MRLPVRLIRGRWPSAVEARMRRFVWDDPRLVLDPGAPPDKFSTAMSAFTVGSTIKITGSNRHPAADALILDHVDLADAVVLDIGASDGSTSVELIGKLPTFGRYVIADLYITATAVQVGERTVFLDHEGNVILVAGRRLVAWPSGSPLVGLLYRRTTAAARQQQDRGHEILLLNPAARALVDSDDRVTYQRHDVFQPWAGPTPDVIKVANVLRRGLYFSEDQIRVALTTLLGNLPEGAHLLMVDNPRAKVPARGGLYRREGGRFIRVAQTEHPTEIDDLVLAVTLQEHEATRHQS